MQGPIKVGPVDVEGLKLTHNESSILLTRLEGDIFNLLVGQEGKPIDVPGILVALYSDKDKQPTNDHIRMMLSKLRKKLVKINQPELVKTIRGEGYVLRQ